MSQDTKWASGQEFQWTYADGTDSGLATVSATWSDQQMGMSPEIEDYAAWWMKASVRDFAKGQPLADREFLIFVLGTDDRIYVNGKHVLLKAQ